MKGDVPLRKVFLANLLYLFSNVRLFVLGGHREGIGGHEGHSSVASRFIVREILGEFEFAAL